VSLTIGSVEPNVRPTGWSARELALFSRAAKSLSSGGLRVETDYGLTDEGEPWLVFCCAESGDVCGHFAKVRRKYVACVPFRGHGLRGCKLQDVLSRFLRRRGIPWSTLTHSALLFCKSPEGAAAGSLACRDGLVSRPRRPATPSSPRRLPFRSSAIVAFFAS
jgi:hypothetical protein